jgi:hypothetical protein
MGVRVSGLRFRVSGLKFRGSQVSSFRSEVLGFGSEVSGFGFRGRPVGTWADSDMPAYVPTPAQGLELRVQGVG